MLKIDPATQRLIALGERTLEPVPLFERFSIRKLIAGGGEALFREAGRPLLIVAEDVELPKLGRRMDFLAIDETGRSYVIACQRSAEHEIDLALPLEEAATVAGWGGEGLLGRLGRQAAERVRLALRTPLGRLNQDQGVVLVAETFSEDTLAAAGWLRERYGVQICCIRVRTAVDRLTGLYYLAAKDVTVEAERAYDQQKADRSAESGWPQLALEPEARSAPAQELDRGRELEAQVAAAQSASLWPGAAGDAPLDAAIAGLVGAEDRETALVARPSLSAPKPEADNRDRRADRRRTDLQARRLRLDYFGRMLGLVWSTSRLKASESRP